MGLGSELGSGAVIGDRAGVRAWIRRSRRGRGWGPILDQALSSGTALGSGLGSSTHVGAGAGVRAWIRRPRRAPRLGSELGSSAHVGFGDRSRDGARKSGLGRRARASASVLGSGVWWALQGWGLSLDPQLLSPGLIPDILGFRKTGFAV